MIDEGIEFRSCSTSRKLPTEPAKHKSNLQNKRPVRVLKKAIHVSLSIVSTKLFVERLEKDKDTDKGVDAYRVRTVRPVGRHWFSQLEEIDIDFRVSGLPHAVLEQSVNSRLRELVKKIESLPHRQDHQADLQ